MDIEKLHLDIQTSLCGDPAAVVGLKSVESGSDSRWSLDDTGLLCYNNRIYVPKTDANPDQLRIQVLQNNHDHILAGHFGQNRTLELIRREYTWPKI